MNNNLRLSHHRAPNRLAILLLNSCNMSTARMAAPLTSSSSSIFRFVFAASSHSTASLQPCRHNLRRVSFPHSAHMSTKRKMQTSTYQPYSLDSHVPPPPRNVGVPNTTIAGIPQVNETRPPQFTEHQLAPSQASSRQTGGSVTEQEAQKSKPISQDASTSAQTKPKPRSRLRARKAAINLTPGAVKQLRELLNQPTPKLIKVGVKNRGCSGLAYNLEYVDKPGTFDETVEQDGVKVLIDSKALFSIIGSEMDWVEDKLNQRFTFKNPNISTSTHTSYSSQHSANNFAEEQCGCGESFMV
jgi:iron-sulfur cluster assembly accessory protein